jgi:hypothetical protein
LAFVKRQIDRDNQTDSLSINYMKKNALILAVTALGLMFRGGVCTQATPLSSYEAAVLSTPGLVDYYKFDDGTANDDVGAYNGSISGLVNFVPGIDGLGQALDFSTNGGLDTLGVVTNIQFPSGDGTVELWVQHNVSSLQCPVAARSDAGDTRWEILLTDSVVDFWSGHGLGSISIPSMGTNWHHLAVVFSGGSWGVVWDGVDMGTQAMTLGTAGQTVNLGSGYAGDPAENWNGELTQVAFYTNALSTSVLAAHYGAYEGAFPPVMVDQPQGRGGVLGQGFQFSVTATGWQPAYQWYQSSTKLQGVTNASFYITNLTTGDAGTYTVTVTTAAGSVTSSPAILAPAQLSRAVSNYQATVLGTPGLVDYYNFYDHTVKDLVGSNNGTLVGAAGFSFGIGTGADSSLDLDGSSSYVDLGVDNDLDFTNGIGTVELWLRASESTVAASAANIVIILCDNGFGNARSWCLSTWPGSPQQLALTTDDYSPSVPSFFPLPASQGTFDTSWHHVGVIFTNKTVTLLWDGQPLGTNAWALPTSLPYGPAFVTMGYWYNGYASKWGGDLTQIAFYTNALPVATVQAHYNACASLIPPVITSQPQGGGILGQAFQVSVGATGLNLAYQWYNGSGMVPSQTNSALSFASLALANAGTYSCVITNLGGSVTSSPAVIAPAALSAAVASYEATVVAEPNLISYFKFDDHTANDSLGNNNGTLIGTASFGVGFGGGPDSALSCDGNGWVDLGQASSLNLFDNGAVELWVKAGWTGSTTEGGAPCMVADRDDGTIYSVHMLPDKSGLIFFNGATAVSAALPASAGTSWHHLVVDLFGNEGYSAFYWDGNLLTTNLPVPGLGGMANTTQIGSSSPTTENGEQWIGELDDVAFYSDILSTGSIQAHYAAYASTIRVIVSITPSGTNVVVSWTAPGSWILEGTTNLSASTWTPLGTNSSPATLPASNNGNLFLRLQAP